MANEYIFRSGIQVGTTDGYTFPISKGTSGQALILGPSGLHFSDVVGGTSTGGTGTGATGPTGATGATGLNGSGVIYDTYGNIQNLITTGALSVGSWYGYTAVNSNDGFTSYYEILGFAATAGCMSSNGYRIMRVPNDSYYSTNYFDETNSYSSGAYVVFGNSYWYCTTSHSNVAPLSPGALDPTYWTEVSYTDASYYETIVCDIQYDWTDGFIKIQSDNKGNVITNIFDLVAKGSVDVHEWNNSKIKNNRCSFVHYNNNFASNTNGEVHNNILNNTTLDEGYIYKNRADVIANNKVSVKILNNKATNISENTSTTIFDNDCSDAIFGNVIGQISTNVSKAIIRNTGGINTSIKDNLGGFSIRYNNIYSGGNISYNDLYYSTDFIQHNNVFIIIGNTNTGSIQYNQGRFPISSNSNGGAIEGNTCQTDKGIDNNSNSGYISYNRVMDGIYNVANADNIGYNDVYSINNI